MFQGRGNDYLAKIKRRESKEDKRKTAVTKEEIYKAGYEAGYEAAYEAEKSWAKSLSSSSMVSSFSVINMAK